MFRLPVVRAAALALLLVGAASTLAFGEGNPTSRDFSARPDIVGEFWSSLRSLVTYLGHVSEVDPNGPQPSSPDAGHDIDPNG